MKTKKLSDSTESVRKAIDIPNDGTYKTLQIMAAKAGKDFKNFIQDLVIEHSKKQKS